MVINFIDGGADTNDFRIRILNVQFRKGTKMAHIPGVNSDILRVIERSGSILKSLDSEAEDIAWILSQSVDTKIESYFGKSTFELSISAKTPWEYDPIVSSGLIRSGSWGNGIPAETFICPKAKYVNGEYCINGSIPGYKLERNEYAVLEIVSGILGTVTSNSKTLKSYFRRIKRLAKGEDYDLKKFAELGIGLNPKIKNLTGSMLYDEKKRETIHIALGDNSFFGFTNEASQHNDLVTVKPSLLCDGHQIMCKGKINFQKIKSLRKEFDKSSPVEETLKSKSFSLAKDRIDKTDYSNLMIVRSKRKSIIKVLSNKEADALESLDSAISDLRQHPYSFFKHNLKGLNSMELNQFLMKLINYKILIPH